MVMIPSNDISSRAAKTQTLDALIERYRNEGLSFIPIPHKSKVPAIEWMQFQQTRPADNQVKGWFNRHDINLAVICGSVSGRLVVLDFDSDEIPGEFCMVIREEENCTIRRVVEFPSGRTSGGKQ